MQANFSYPTPCQIDPYNGDMAGRPPTKPAPPFGERLAALRKEHGLTQPQLAQKLDLSVDMLTYYERRAKNPTVEFLNKVAKALNVSTDELLGYPVKLGRKSGPPSQIEQRLTAIRQLSRERQKLLLQVLDTFLRDAQNSNGHKQAA
jgi:transcriptional regulator with XRE-family HTH domain